MFKSKNVPEAIYWVTRAVEQGEPFAYGTLAKIRYDGNSFDKNDIETLKWYILALKDLPKGTSRKNDQKNFDTLKKRMTSSQIKEAQRLAHEWQPLKDGGSTMRDKDDK